MAKIIIIYSTTDGHTRDICDCLLQEITSPGDHVMLCSIEDSNTLDLAVFDKIVLGASIRYGKHDKKVYQFIEQHLAILNEKANAFFSVNVVARKPDKNTPETNPYLIKFLRQIAWQPKKLAVFAGMIDYQKYKFFDRFMIRFIMWMTKGPTDLNASIDFTNWDKVKEFAQQIRKM